MHVVMTANAAWNIWNFRQPVVRALLADGHRVTVLAPPDPKVTNLEALGCTFIPFAMDVKGLNPFNDLALLVRYHKHFKASKPDVILSYTIKSNIFGSIVASRLGIRFVPNVSGLGTAFLSGGVLQMIAEKLYRSAFKHLDTIFFQNVDDRDLFVERRLVRSCQAQLIPGSGIDLNHFQVVSFPSPAEPPTFLMIGRLLRDKGSFEFVDAARRVKAATPEVRFQLLGALGAENRTAIDAATVARWRADGVVEYLGSVSDVRPFIASATCVVLPSYREGAPRTLIEAAAMGRPLIATDVPGCRSVVEDGVTGFLCRPRSSESLAATCNRLLKLAPGEQRAMGMLGRKKMEQEFDHKLVVAAYREAVTRTKMQLSEIQSAS
jgi:glycosyltransferase involved in cell wall biosynthesis